MAVGHWPCWQRVARGADATAAAAVVGVVHEVEAVVDLAVAVVVEAVADLGRRQPRRRASTSRRPGRPGCPAAQTPTPVRARRPAVDRRADAVVDGAVAVVVDAVAGLDAAVGELALAAVGRVAVGVDEARRAGRHAAAHHAGRDAVGLRRAGDAAAAAVLDVAGRRARGRRRPGRCSRCRRRRRSRAAARPAAPPHTTSPKLALQTVFAVDLAGAHADRRSRRPRRSPRRLWPLQLLSMPSQRSSICGLDGRVRCRRSRPARAMKRSPSASHSVAAGIAAVAVLIDPVSRRSPGCRVKAAPGRCRCSRSRPGSRRCRRRPALRRAACGSTRIFTGAQGLRRAVRIGAPSRRRRRRRPATVVNVADGARLRAARRWAASTGSGAKS